MENFGQPFQSWSTLITLVLPQDRAAPSKTLPLEEYRILCTSPVLLRMSFSLIGLMATHLRNTRPGLDSPSLTRLRRRITSTFNRKAPKPMPHKSAAHVATCQVCDKTKLVWWLQRGITHPEWIRACADCQHKIYRFNRRNPKSTRQLDLFAADPQQSARDKRAPRLSGSPRKITPIR